MDFTFGFGGDCNPCSPCGGCPSGMCENGTLATEQQDAETSGDEADAADADNVIQFDDADDTVTTDEGIQALPDIEEPADLGIGGDFLIARGVTAMSCVYNWGYTDDSGTVQYEYFDTGVSTETGDVASVAVVIYKFLNQDDDVCLFKLKQYTLTVTALSANIEFYEFYFKNLGAGPVDCCGGPWTLDGFDYSDDGFYMLRDAVEVDMVADSWAIGNNWDTPGTSEVTPVCP